MATQTPTSTPTPTHLPNPALETDLTLLPNSEAVVSQLILSQWIRRRRKSLDLTQAELAHKLACSISTIQKVEEGERRPSKNLTASLVRALEIPEEHHQAFARLVRSKAVANDKATVTQTDTKPAPFNNIPHSLNELIGRDGDATTACSLLQHKPARLLTLCGPPGVGKTRLALEIAHRVAASFADGACYVALCDVDQANQVAAFIANALTLKIAAGQPASNSTTRRLIEALRNKHMLLVLDSFEHVLAAASTLTELLSACPRIKVVVTSQAALHISGEHQRWVQPLALPDSSQPLTLSELAQVPAVAVFLASAQAVQSEFVLSAGNAQDIAQICIRLDGLPLALELAATRLRLMGPNALLKQLARTTATQHPILANPIRRSYALLGKHDQIAFRKLSIFAGGFTEDAAQSVCAVSHESIAALVHHSLLQTQPGSSEMYFKMLESIRQFALDRLRESGQLDVINAQYIASQRPGASQ